MNTKIFKTIRQCKAALYRYALAISALVVLPVSSAFASNVSAGDNMGLVIIRTVESFATFPNILAAIAYLAGVYLGVSAIFKFRAHVDMPNQIPISDGVKRVVAGGMFLALPTILMALYETLALDIAPVEGTGYNTDGTGTGQGLDGMLIAFMRDISGPMGMLLGGFSYIAGIALAMVGISRLVKSTQEGPRGPTGMGTLMTFLASAGLLSLGNMMGAFTESLFGTDQVVQYATLSSNITAGIPDINHVYNVISAVLAFIAIVGWISFIRGWFLLKAHADGNQQASLMGGLTHLFGGALAVNLGAVLNAVQTTFGLSAGISFT